MLLMKCVMVCPSEVETVIVRHVSSQPPFTQGGFQILFLKIQKVVDGLGRKLTFSDKNFS